MFAQKREFDNASFCLFVCVALLLAWERGGLDSLVSFLLEDCSPGFLLFVYFLRHSLATVTGFVLIVQYLVSQNSFSSGGTNCFAVVFLAAGGEGQSLQEGEAEREEEAGRGRFDL